MKAHRFKSILFLCLVLISQSHRADDSSKPLFRSAFPMDALRNVTPADAKLSAEILIRKFVEKEGYAYETHILKNHESLIEGLKNEEFDFFLMYAYEFLEHDEKLGLTPELLGVRSGNEPEDELILLVKKDGGIESAKGGELLIQRGAGKLPIIWLEEDFAERKMPDPSEYFRKITVCDRLSQTVLSVFFGKAAACIVTRESYDIMVELNPQIAQRLDKFSVSNLLLNTVICRRSSFQEIRPGSLKTIGATLHEESDGKQILSLMQVAKLKVFEPKSLVNLQTLLEKRKQRLAGSTPSAAGEVAP